MHTHIHKSTEQKICIQIVHDIIQFAKNHALCGLYLKYIFCTLCCQSINPHKHVATVKSILATFTFSVVSWNTQMAMTEQHSVTV